MKKYYYKTKKNKYNNPVRIEQCCINKEIKIGSENCSKCGNFFAGSVSPNGKGWIKCLKIGLIKLNKHLASKQGQKELQEINDSANKATESIRDMTKIPWELMYVKFRINNTITIIDGSF